MAHPARPPRSPPRPPCIEFRRGGCQRRGLARGSTSAPVQIAPANLGVAEAWKKVPLPTRQDRSRPPARDGKSAGGSGSVVRGASEGGRRNSGVANVTPYRCRPRRKHDRGGTPVGGDCSIACPLICVTGASVVRRLLVLPPTRPLWWAAAIPAKRPWRLRGNPFPPPPPLERRRRQPHPLLLWARQRAAVA